MVFWDLRGRNIWDEINILLNDRSELHYLSKEVDQTYITHNLSSHILNVMHYVFYSCMIHICCFIIVVVL